MACINLSICRWCESSNCFSILNQVKGMTIDQALAQLEFSDKKGAKVVKDVRNLQIIDNQNSVYCQVGLHLPGICSGV